MDRTKMIVVMLVLRLSAVSLQAQKVYELDANIAEQKISTGPLKLGGINDKGESLAVNNYYLTLNHKPFIPVMGEFHFSRYPHRYWDESIRKMKAAGITVIATYVFWILHEEEEGKFVWTDDKNLREFIDLCGKNNLYVIVRIGPFCHGEIRNGGLPDWLLGKPLNIRMNDSLYLSYVERLYNEIGNQLKNMYFKDGGPVIGVQIENEYQHSAAPWGLTYPGQPLDFTSAERDRPATHAGVSIAAEKNPYAELGNDHMRVLKSLAIKAGMITPLYTATGWGNAAILPNESIPVTAAYAYPFWTPNRDYSPFFLYKNMHLDPDYSPVRYKPEDYPSFPAELGSGINLTYSRRPIPVHRSFDAMANRCLGSGANGVGYYMFHGGSTPRGKNNFMNDEAYGLTKISYEYQGPIGEFGQIREGFHRLKLIHYFLNDFGDLLAPMTVLLPANAASLRPENIHDLRYAARIKGSGGFLFLNNFQDDTTMLDQVGIQMKIKTPAGNLLIPEKGGFNLLSGENVIFPFNFNLNGAHLNYATAQLLMKGDTADSYYVFFTPDGINAEFSFSPGITVENINGTLVSQDNIRILVKSLHKWGEFSVIVNGKKTYVLFIDKAMALKSYIVSVKGRKSLLFSDATALPAIEGIDLLSDGMSNFDIDIYPKNNSLPNSTQGTMTENKNENLFSSYHLSLTPFEFPVTVTPISDRKISVLIPQMFPPGINDFFLTMNYTGDTGMDFVNGKLVADNFYNGIPWQIGLRKFISSDQKTKEMVFYFRPMEKNASYLLDLEPFPKSIPEFGTENTYLKINQVTFKSEYKTTIKF